MACVALLAQDIIELQTHRSSLSLEKTVSQLCVPQKFISIHFVIGHDGN